MAIGWIEILGTLDIIIKRKINIIFQIRNKFVPSWNSIYCIDSSVKDSKVENIGFSMSKMFSEYYVQVSIYNISIKHKTSS